MDEFHDFVVDVGLETKIFKFNVMCNQFVKANATNTAQVRAQRQDEKRDAQAKAFDREVNSLKEVKKAQRGVGKVKGSSDGEEAVRDQELVLYEWMNMLVRIAFWRANSNFGLWVNKDGDGVKDKEVNYVPVTGRALRDAQRLCAAALQARELTRLPRQRKEMREASVRGALHAVKPKIKEWYTELVRSTLSSNNDDKLGFDEWMRVRAARAVGRAAVHRPLRRVGGRAAVGDHGRPEHARHAGQVPPLGAHVQGRLHGLAARRPAGRRPGLGPVGPGRPLLRRVH
jgi:hypothetical protein